MARLDAAIPTSPLVDANGNIRPEWRAFFSALWIRTGGSIGQVTDTEHLQEQINNEATVRAAADATLRAGIDNEAALRAAGDIANQQAATAGLAQEVVARQAGDAAVASLIYNSTTGWQQALQDYVPIAQLCTLWAGCDLSFLPTADPGHGQPWLNDNVLSVGTSSSVVARMVLEAGGTVYWTLEGAGDWLWG